MSSPFDFSFFFLFIVHPRPRSTMNIHGSSICNSLCGRRREGGERGGGRTCMRSSACLQTSATSMLDWSTVAASMALWRTQHPWRCFATGTHASANICEKKIEMSNRPKQKKKRGKRGGRLLKEAEGTGRERVEERLIEIWSYTSWGSYP